MNLLRDQIQKSLQLREDLVQQTENEAELLALIEQLIQELIDNDFEQFLRLLYRIDLNEQKVKEVIASRGPEHATKSIAVMILEREKEKAKSREEHKSDSPDWEFL